MKQKIVNVKAVVAEHIHAGRYRYTIHYQEQSKGRFISRQEIRYVLLNGRHEKRRDRFDMEYNAWSYAMRGRTLDKDRELRAIVSFIDDEMIIVTAYDIIN
jgi:hypothetical protein